MKDITPILLTYREALMYLWNTYYVIDDLQGDVFRFETDKAFSLVKEGLFNSLVQAKVFDYTQSPDSYRCWEIYVVPHKTIVDIKIGTWIGRDCHFEDIKIDVNGAIFKYIDLFDWDQEGLMKGEFVRTKCFSPSIASAEKDLLFDVADVRFYLDR